MKFLLALFAVCFVIIGDAAAQCPSLFPPITRTRVSIVHKHYSMAPMVAVQAAPVVSVPVVEAPAPSVDVVTPVPAPAVTYSYRTTRTYAVAPMVSAYDDVGVGASSTRASRKAAHHTLRAAVHAAKAAYWATR